MATGWTESSPGVFRKPVGGAEDLTEGWCNAKLFGGREHYALFMVICFETDDTNLPLTDAWLSLRFYMPDIAVELDGQDKVYRVTSRDDLDSWLSNSFFVVEDLDSHPEEHFTTLTPPQSVELYYFPHRSAIALRASHWRYDWDGLLMVANRYLELLASPVNSVPWGGEAQHLRSRFDEAFNLPEQSPTDVKAYVKGMYGRAAAAGPSLGLSIKGSHKDPPGRTATTQEVLSPNETSALVDACHSAGYTVTSAVTAAFAYVTYDLAPAAADGKNQTLMIPRDGRRLAHAPFNGEDYAANSVVYVSWVPLGPKGATFHELADVIQRYIHTDFPADVHLRSMKEIKGYIEAFMQMAPSEGYVPPMTPVVSSLGVIERYLKRAYPGNAARGARAIRIQDVSLQADVMTPQLTAWIYTFDGKLRIKPSFNAAFLDISFVEDLLHRVLQVLQQGLGIDLESRVS